MLRLQDIFGQDRAIQTLRRAYLADRLPHGLIFAGPVGVGKATAAAALAGLFLCEQPSGDEPCGQCAACRVFAAGNHPDHHIITKELIRYHDKTGKSKGIDLSIHVIRPELIEVAGRKAVMGRGKVFLVEQADLMSVAAQNAMLKTLEEPAGRALIILLTDQAHALLPTIRSRCQTVLFGALEAAKIATELGRRGVDGAAAAEAAGLSEGSLGLALKWIEDGVIQRAAQLHSMLQRIVEGASAGIDLPEWMKQSAEVYAEKQLERDELASKDQATREGVALYLRLASQFFRSRLTASGGAAAAACDAIDALVRAEKYLDANLNVSLISQQLAVTLERLYPAAPAGRH